MANTNVTLDEQYKTILSNVERVRGFTHKYRIPYTVVDEGSGATDTVTVTLDDTPTDWVVDKAAINVTTAFAGTAGGFAVEVGTDGDANNFITSTSVKTAGPTITLAGAAPTTLAGSFAAASDVLQAVFTNDTSGAPEDLTAGEVEILLGLYSLNDAS